MTTHSPVPALDHYDVVVIGGGAAGLAGATTLARSRRSVLVIDGGAPRNAPAAGVHALLALDGVAPAELLARGRTEVARYGGEVVCSEVVAADVVEGGFTVTLASGSAVGARRLLVATGTIDTLPEIPGLAEHWGRSVVHCPYCHGWEVRDQPIGVIASHPMFVHQALLFRQLTDDVVVFTHGVDPTPEQRAQLLARGIGLVETGVTAIRATDGAVTGVELSDGRVEPRTVLTVQSTLRPRVEALSGLGLRVAENPMGQYVPTTDAGGRSEVPGVWLAGNVTEQSAQVGASAAAGTMAGAQINADLGMAETAAAVAAMSSGAA